MGDQSDDSAVTRAKAPVVAACTAAMLALAICAYVFTRGWTSFGCLVAVLVLYAAVAWRVVARNWTSRQRWDAMTMPDHVSRFAYYTVPPVVLLVLGSAAVYWQLGHQAGSACMSPPLDRASAVYFAATTFTTTGYGDIRPVSTACRSVVTAQMGLGFGYLTLILGVFLAHFAEALSRRR